MYINSQFVKRVQGLDQGLVLCRVFGCSYTGYSKQEHEFVGCECEHPGGRGAGSRELPPTCTGPYIHTHIQTHIYIHIYTYTYVDTYVRAYIHTYIYIIAMRDLIVSLH